MNDPDPGHRSDKLALFILAAFVVAVLGAMVVGILWMKSVPDRGDALLGAIAAGLILFLRDLVNAVRGSWEEVTRSKISDQLAGSAPAQDVVATGRPGDPVHMVEENKGVNRGI